MEPVTMFIGEGSHVFSKKNPSADAENEISMTCYTPQHYAEISSCIISLLFSTFSLPRKYLHTIKCLSGSSFCRIQVCTKVLVFEQLFNLWINENSFSQLGLTYFGEIFALNSQTLHFLYLLLARIFLSN